MRIKNLVVLFLVITGLVGFTSHLVYRLGKWVAFYEASMRHLGAME